MPNNQEASNSNFLLRFLGLKPNSSEILSIQYLRGIASLSVMLFHFTFAPEKMNELNGIGYFIYLIFSRMYLGVNIFFCISGFVLLYSLIKSNYTLSGFGNFLLRRITRIEPPYMLSVLMVVALAAILAYLGKPVDKDISIQNIFMHFGYLNTFTGGWLLDIYWTLAVEFVFYLSIGLAFPLVVGKAIFRYMLFGLFLASSPFMPHHSLPFFAPFFVIGMEACLLYTKKIERSEFLVFTGISLFLMMWVFEKGAFSFSIEGVIKAFLTLATVFYFFQKPKFSTWWYVLGTISYSLYLLHTIIGSALVKVAKDDAFTSPKRIAVVLVAAFVSIVASLLYFKFVEKPSISLSKKLTGKS